MPKMKTLKILKSLLKCKFCRRRYQDDEELKSHLQKRHSTEPGHPCGKCTYMTAPIAPPKPEIEIFPPQILRPALFECFVCNVKLRTLSDFKNHFQAQHRVNATSRSQRFTCAFCECQFTKQNLFTHHMVRVHLEDRYSLVKELKPKKEFQNLSKISKPSHHQKRKQVHHQRQEPDQDLELLKAIEILEKSIDKEDDTEESVKDNTLGDTKPAKRDKYLLFSNSKGDLFEFTCAFCQDKFLDMKKFMAHAEKFHLKSN